MEESANMVYSCLLDNANTLASTHSPIHTPTGTHMHAMNTRIHTHVYHMNALTLLLNLLQLIMIYAVSRSISNTVDFLGPYWYNELTVLMIRTINCLDIRCLQQTQ